jgi:hypothetical protein
VSFRDFPLARTVRSFGHRPKWPGWLKRPLVCAL